MQSPRFASYPQPILRNLFFFAFPLLCLASAGGQEVDSTEIRTGGVRANHFVTGQTPHQQSPQGLQTPKTLTRAAPSPSPTYSTKRREVTRRLPASRERDQRPLTGPVLFELNGHWKMGLHLVDSSTESLVISRDGWLHTIKHSDHDTRLRRSTESYAPASVAEMRNELRAEFGKDFEVVATKHFLVVQPRGRGDRWPQMFELCHRSFLSFMSKQGVRVRKGRFPMVAVVLPDARAMYAELDRLKIDVSRVAGIYANRCNRVMTHDGGHLASIAATVRHEAAHQSAFNSGIHSRVNDTPSWITEGVGQMFEPEALASGTSATRLAERVNRDSLDYLRKHLDLSNAGELHDWIQKLIVSDDSFRDSADVHMAYSVAWAMMFYLSERETEKFADVLQFTATRPPFANYSRSQRRIDFERIVDEDVQGFSNRLARYLSQLP